MKLFYHEDCIGSISVYKGKGLRGKLRVRLIQTTPRSRL
mgnify:FL=1